MHGDMKFVPADSNENAGILEIDMTASFLINDGQHRKAAIEAAIAEDESLKEETISIVLYKDQGLQRSQQMFTDLNKHAVTTSNEACWMNRAIKPNGKINRNEQGIFLTYIQIKRLLSLPVSDEETKKERIIMG